MTKLRAGVATVAVIGAALAATNLSANAPNTEAQSSAAQSSCTVSPAGPVSISILGSQQFTYGGSCAGHNAAITPKPKVGFDGFGCLYASEPMSARGDFTVYGCQETEAELTIWNGGVLIQTIAVSVVP